MSAISIPTCPILIVDDDEMLLRTYERILRSNGFNNILLCEDSRDVEAILDKEELEAVLLDLTMPHISGEEILNMMRLRVPDVPVLISTGANEVVTAVNCMRAGAFDYMVKPVEKDRLITSITRAMELRELKRENVLLKEHFMAEDLKNPEAFADIKTRNKAMLATFQYIEAIVPAGQPVLIMGETGVGKELMARAIHKASRSKGPFVPVTVAGLDDRDFVDTIFGHKKESFPGADSDRPGLIEEAVEGTLFIDEIGGLSLSVQAKLLRLLQDHEYYPIGSDIAKRSACRIIFATNSNLREKMESAEFRDDLYYKLWSHHIEIPPLRERPDDLPVLVDHFLGEAANSIGKRKPTPPRELVTLLVNYEFPGNVRELRALVYDAVSKHRSGVLAMDSFRESIKAAAGGRQTAEDISSEMKELLQEVHPLPTFKQVDQMLIEEALRRANGNQTIAAQLLGTTRQTLNRHLKLMK
jgi:DNA-binding NtrC family response regulator